MPNLNSDKEVRKHLNHLRLQGAAALTIYHRERALIRLAAFLAGTPLLDATADQLYDWRASLKVSDGTAAGYISNVKEFYRWAEGNRYLITSPAEDIPVPRIPRRVPRPITEKHLAAAIAHSGGHVRIWLILAAWCGLRAKEIACLRAENVRLDDSRPVIIIASDATKGITERVVDVCDFAARELRAYGLPARGPCWLRANGEPIRPWWVSKQCNAYLHEDVGTASTLHTLRARFATAAVDAGQDVVAVKELMGHASLDTTMRYTLHSRRRHRAIVNKLPVPGKRAAVAVALIAMIAAMMTTALRR